MLEREPYKMLCVKVHLLSGDDESEVIHEEKLKFELVEFWEGKAAYLGEGEELKSVKRDKMIW